MGKPGTPGKIALTAGQFSRCPALNETPGQLKGSVLSPLNQGHFQHPKTSYLVCNTCPSLLFKALVLPVGLIWKEKARAPGVNLSFNQN